jgi:hypothetical protein
MEVLCLPSLITIHSSRSAIVPYVHKSILAGTKHLNARVLAGYLFSLRTGSSWHVQEKSVHRPVITCTVRTT